MDHNKNGLIFAVEFPLSIILISLFLTIASYLCTPNHNNNPSLDHQNTTSPQNTNQNFVAVEIDGGLDEATLYSFPKLLYSQYNLKKSSSASAASCCSICLADYKETDSASIATWLRPSLPSQVRQPMVKAPSFLPAVSEVTDSSFGSVSSR